MRQGTTPYIEIQVDTDLSAAKVVVVTFQDLQGNQFDVGMESGRIKISSQAIQVHLDQKETLALTNGKIKAQIRARLTSEEALASNIMYFTLESVLKRGEI